MRSAAGPREIDQTRRRIRLTSWTGRVFDGQQDFFQPLFKQAMCAAFSSALLAPMVLFPNRCGASSGHISASFFNVSQGG
jgi:hypothetical protein